MRGWLLNLDVERELAHPHRPADPFAALEHRPALLEALRALLGEDRIVRRDDRPLTKHTSAALQGHAWCPTPAARTALERAGFTVGAAPDVATLARVNHRSFSSALPATIDEARFVTSESAALRAVERASPSGAWLIKRPFGFAGRGRAVAPPLNDAVRRFIHAAVNEEGGVAIEPLLERALDVSIHGHLDQKGQLERGQPTVQIVTPQGVWQSTRRASPGEVDASEQAALRSEVDRVAAALCEAGYFGPFGIDAFRYRLGTEVKMQSRCEINARYTMGWAIGMGENRPDLR